ncbi:glycoside hydrolase family protein [Flavitalea antarctica]
MIKVINLLFCLLLFSSLSCSNTKDSPVPDEPGVGITGKLEVYPSPGAGLATVEHLTQSNDYIVEVRRKGESAFQKCFVYKTDNYWVDKYFRSPAKPQISASFTSFAFTETAVEVKITYAVMAGNVTIRPLNSGIIPVHSGNSISFTLNKPGKISVEVNDRKNPLFIFTEAPDVPDTKATYYYGPGVHKIGLQKSIKSNESVYIAAGAVVEGSFLIPYNTSNVNIKGRGILSMGEWKHESTDISWLGAHSAIKGNGVSNLQMEGLIIANSCGWTIPIYNSDNLTHDNQFRNLKLVSWNGNTDGFWVNGNNHIIDDCFIFNNDDIFMSHGASNCKITNIVAWRGPWGRLYWLNDQKNTTDIQFDNINLIGKDGGVGVILVDGGASGNAVKISDIIFRNLRIESHPKLSSYNTNKFLVVTSAKKTVSNWLFENLTIDDKNPDEGDIYGTALSPVNGITFRNFKLGGTAVGSLSDAGMDVNSFTTNIKFE